MANVLGSDIRSAIRNVSFIDSRCKHSRSAHTTTCLQRFCAAAGGGFNSSLAAKRIAASCQYVSVMTEAIEQRRSELFVAEHFDPLGERQIGGDDGRAAFIALGQQVEQQLGSYTSVVLSSSPMPSANSPLPPPLAQTFDSPSLHPSRITRTKLKTFAPLSAIKLTSRQADAAEKRSILRLTGAIRLGLASEEFLRWH